jgi:hypothetical protein
VHRVATVLILLALGALAQVSRAQDAPESLAWLLSDAPDGWASHGARMGAAEMNQTAALLGRRFGLREHEVRTAEQARTALASSAAGGTVFVLLDLDWHEACLLAGGLEDGGPIVPVALRPASYECEARVLQIRRPQQAREALLAEHEHLAPARRLRVDEWHPSLGRFGAGELNERFQRLLQRLAPRASAGMNGDAWAGWFGVKVAAEASLRGLQAAQLTADNAPRFDGHKGVALQFDSGGVLTQPVYVIDDHAAANGRAVVAEIR